LWDPTTGASQVTMTTSAALSLNLKLQVLEVRRREDVAGAVRVARHSQAEALTVFSSPFLASLHREIIAFAAEYRLPAIYQWKEHVEAGGVVSYGPNLAAIWRQFGIIVAKVLKGVKPADLPVEQGELSRPQHPAFGSLARRRGNRMIARRGFITVFGTAVA